MEQQLATLVTAITKALGDVSSERAPESKQTAFHLPRELQSVQVLVSQSDAAALGQVERILREDLDPEMESRLSELQTALENFDFETASAALTGIPG